MSRISKKISVKAICGKIIVKRDPETGIPLPFPEKPVLRVYGIAMKTKTVDTQYGQSTGFIGSFEGINIATGESIKGSECWLPEVVQDLLAPVIDANPAGVQLAFDLTIKPSDRAAGQGYEYGIISLLPVSEADDPLAAMRAALPKLPLLTDGGSSDPAAGTEPPADTEPPKSGKKGSGDASA